MIKKTLRDLFFHFMIFASPAYVAVSYRFNEISEFNHEIIENLGLEDWLARNKTIVIIFLTFLVPIIFTFIKRWLEERYNEKEEIFYQQLYDVSGKIFVVLNDVLMGKRTSARNCIYQLESDPNFTITLSDIVKPTEQMLKIFQGITYIFRKITNNDGLKVSIIECRNGEIHNYLYQSDDEARTSIEELSKRRSTAKQCMAKKKMIIYEKTGSLLQRQWFVGDKTRIKSIVCFPVISGKETLYVISLTSKEEKTFLEKSRKKYDLIFEQLSYRILLESYLSKILQLELTSNKIQ